MYVNICPQKTFCSQCVRYPDASCMECLSIIWLKLMINVNIQHSIHRASGKK